MMSDMGLEQRNSPERFRSATSLNERGDMAVSTSPGGSRCVMQKFCNGVRVPVFLADGGDRNHSSLSHKTKEGSKGKGNKHLPFGQSDEDNDVSPMLLDLYTCPICMEPMIEVTATSCGHTFCASCLEEWSKVKPVCPICSQEITHRIRLYNEDQFIEWYLRTNEDFPPELGRRLYEATKLRMDKRSADGKKTGSVLARVRAKLDDLRMSTKSKGVWGTVRNQFNQVTARRMRGGFSSSEMKQAIAPSWRPSQGTILVIGGILIGLFAAFAISKFWIVANFLHYLYLSIRNYDGTIPDHLINGIGTGDNAAKHEVAAYAMIDDQSSNRVATVGTEVASHTVYTRFGKMLWFYLGFDA